MKDYLSTKLCSTSEWYIHSDNHSNWVFTQTLGYTSEEVDFPGIPGTAL